MIELQGNLFEPKTWARLIGEAKIKYVYPLKPDALVITTNGFVKSDGRCVMGRGCAFEAKQRYPNIDLELGRLIKLRGNIPLVITGVNPSIVSFPVKPRAVKASKDCANVVHHMKENFSEGDVVPGWAALADLELINQSAMGLKLLADKNSWKVIVSPRFGCGAGELKWENIKPVIEKYLDDRFYCITF